MDPKALIQKFRDFLDSLGSDDDADEPNLDAPEGEPGDNIREGDAPTDDAENTPADGADDTGAADGAAENEGDGEEEETLPDSEAELAQLRDSCTALATENERLRTILTDNGIDFEGTPEIDAAVEKADETDEADAMQDDEDAQADIDAIKARNAQW